MNAKTKNSENNKPKSNLIHGDLTNIILNCCFTVINELGSGFLEAVYKNALKLTLEQQGLRVNEEVSYEIMFREVNIGTYYADLVVDEKVIIELKCCKTLLPEHSAQVINYLNASKIMVGLLVNFGQYSLEYKRLQRKDLFFAPFDSSIFPSSN